MNVYKITYEHYDLKDSSMVHKTKFIEALDYTSALSILKKIYDMIEDCIITDIISMERVAKDVIHGKIE